MTALYLTVFGGPATAAARAQTPAATLRPAESPDALFANREDLASARRAADLWALRAEADDDFEAAWKLARVCYYLGTLGPEAGRRAALDRGVRAGQQAATIAPAKPEGHFWAAANMGRLAESFGISQGLKYRAAIKSELERVIAIQPGWLSGSAESALAQYYEEAPLWYGSHSKAVELARKALSYDPDNPQAMFTLADVLSSDKKSRDEARILLQHVIAAPIDPAWAPEDRDLKRQAEELLKKMGK